MVADDKGAAPSLMIGKHTPRYLQSGFNFLFSPHRLRPAGWQTIRSAPGSRERTELAPDDKDKEAFVRFVLIHLAASTGRNLHKFLAALAPQTSPASWPALPGASSPTTRGKSGAHRRFIEAKVKKAAPVVG